MGLDLKYFYLNSHANGSPRVPQNEASIFPDDVITHYNLEKKATKDGFVFCKKCKGMHDLPHTGLIAQQLIEKRLEKHDY